MTLTTITLLSAHLTADNHRRPPERGEAQEQAGRRAHRRAPAPAAGGAGNGAEASRAEGAYPSGGRQFEFSASDDSALVLAPPPPPLRPAIVTPLAPERYKVQFTVSRATHDKLRRAQDLLRHSIPNGDPAAIFDRALTVLLKDLEQARLAATERPRAARPVASGSRHIPAAVKREVWKRDGGQCAFVGTQGRCTERGFLEFHHVRPYADGGASVVENLEIRCRAHNLHEAEQYFGSRLPLLVRESKPGYGFATRSGPSSALCLL